MPHPASNQSPSATGAPESTPALNPGDAAPPGTEGTGEGICPVCGGTGQQDGAPCKECGGSGTVIVGVGGG